MAEVPENVFLCQMVAELTVIGNDLRAKKGYTRECESIEKATINVLTRLIEVTRKQLACSNLVFMQTNRRGNRFTDSTILYEFEQATDADTGKSYLEEVD